MNTPVAGRRASDASSKSEVLPLPGEERAKPPLKWAGGKRWLVPHLFELWKQHKKHRYVEPFCGGLALPLGLRPQRALLNDINPHLINFYRHLQKGLKTSIDFSNDSELFYGYRDRFNQLIQNGGAETAEAALLFYYLNRTCFNGLCRFNQSGEFNVPFGSYRTINYETDFSPYTEALKNWVFSAGDLQSVLVAAEDFIYADPPYDVEFTSYSAGGFSWQDQVRTAEWLQSHPGPAVISNQATPRIIKLYKRMNFQITFLQGPRRISCTGDRSAVREVLAIKPARV